jgi:hypothetical protein
MSVKEGLDENEFGGDVNTYEKKIVNLQLGNSDRLSFKEKIP